MTIKECIENKAEHLKNELEEQLRGDCCCDFITKEEWCEIVEDFNFWAKTANNGDAYYYDDNEYKVELEFGLLVWQNEEQREVGEPIYMTPTCSSTDLDAIKNECESYDIESTGCIEIIVEGEDDAILHYENDEWTEVE